MPAMTSLPTFTNGSVPVAANFTSLASNIETLTQITTGQPTSQAPSRRSFAKIGLANPQAIATATPTLVSWDGDSTDPDHVFGLQTPTVGAARYAGWYRITAQVAFDSAAAAERSAFILVNGSSIPTNVTAATTNQMGRTNNHRLQVVAYEHLAANATFYVGVVQSSGATVNLLTGAQWGTWLSVVWDAPY
jgi:hypothetical protein